MDTGLTRYYARRAAEYERIYARPERQADLRAIEAWLPAAFAGRHVLEVACGTGWWTPHGARAAASWLATDLSREVLEIARRKPVPPVVRFEVADAWALGSLAGGDFDAAFAGFWWSHVPRARLPGWLAALHARLRPGARIVFVDNRFVEGSSTPIARTAASGDTYQQRTLDDGSVHEVLKNFPTRAEAFGALGPRAHRPDWVEHQHYWILDYTLGPA
jgi:demethylmenaquinone methyltransferase/2-methoxy-6-polyprenyl-1,4-benzoquinol methylase